MRVTLLHVLIAAVLLIGGVWFGALFACTCT